MNSLLYRAIAFVLLTLLSMPTAWAAAHFRAVGRLSGGVYVEPQAVSDNGVVVGYGEGPNGQTLAFWARRGHRPKTFGPLNGSPNGALGVSADGSVIVGSVSSTAGFFQGFYWNARAGFTDFNPSPDVTLEAFSISGDGRVVVGYFGMGFILKAFRWSAVRGFEELDDLGGGEAVADAASYTGDVIVGSVTPLQSNTRRACRWLTNGPAELLGGLNDTASDALDISPDGTVIVGQASFGDVPYRAFRWTLQTGMERIDTNGNVTASQATAVSARGHIVGTATVAGSTEGRAFLWTPQHGLRLMDEVFSSALPRGVSFLGATDISADGRWIIGNAYDSRRGLFGFVLNTRRMLQ